MTPPTVVILAAGLGSRLAKPFPKPLTPLHGTGTSIMQQQVEHLGAVFPGMTPCVVVGFKKDLIMESFPDSLYVYNEDYADTNTSKSLLKALTIVGPGGVLWLNGDVVFDERVIDDLLPHIATDRSFVCVNTASVGEEEVKYTLDNGGRIQQLSKTVLHGARGEAVGINFISAEDRPMLIRRLEECDDQDYFERGIELAIEKDGLCIDALDISHRPVIEIDFAEDLIRANNTF